MILFDSSPNIDSSPSAMTDVPRQAPDQDREARHQAPAPPGASCLRCGGLLVPSYTASLERDLTGNPVTLWRCVNCGDCVDHDILANRGKGSLGRHGCAQDHRQGLNSPDVRTEWGQA